MKITNRSLPSAATVLLAGLAAALVQPTAAFAQSGSFPSQRITFVVGFAAGGFADTIGRMVASRLGERTGQTVVVQNMEGGGGIRAARRVVTSPADGYTVLVTTNGAEVLSAAVPKEINELLRLRQ